ncbi:thiol reductase thioredoxin [Bacillus sp. TH22]|uniref:thioredoxin family protein n=1 Tax=unclassified Bacillus (in: firmicutes) TaxID=185979 RepID=UPI001911C63C|nr:MULTISPECIES: thioredoxin domain-containing protein [unclassified Bacillus (in: firmicutes)]MBK5452486.1 thiol reductase thioredoxin [Bacillus sp. TH22]MBK5457908.1 thiol reductase thioredoxin [Bacillus sp. TH23]
MPLETLADMNFRSTCFISDMPVLIEFTADWCKPCKGLEPIIEKISEDKKGAARFFKADVDECPLSAQDCSIKSLPTVIVFRDGEELGRLEGITTREKVIELLGV